MCVRCLLLSIYLLLKFTMQKELQMKKKTNHVSRFLSWNLSTSQGSFESAFFYLYASQSKVSECVEVFVVEVKCKSGSSC